MQSAAPLQTWAGGCTPDVLLNQYIDGTSDDDIPAFFFRTTFQVKDAGAVTKLRGALYDDAAIVYINGVKVAAFDEPDGGFAPICPRAAPMPQTPKPATLQ